MVEVSLTVGKLDASLALLLTKDHHLIEFPTILLPDGINAGSVVTIKCEQDTKEEEKEAQEFSAVQDEILQLFGTAEPTAPVLKVKNVTQTSAVLEWDPLELGSSDIKALTLYKNGSRLGVIPNPLVNTTTKLSGLPIDTEYEFYLRLDTTAGVYESEHVKLTTHKMTDLSGITVCLGEIEGVKTEDIVESLEKIGAKPLQDSVKVDTTHFISTEGSGPQWKKALDSNIPIVRPEWLKACELERRIVGVRNFYLDADPKFLEQYRFNKELPTPTQTERSNAPEESTTGAPVETNGEPTNETLEDIPISEPEQANETKEVQGSQEPQGEEVEPIATEQEPEQVVEGDKEEAPAVATEEIKSEPESQAAGSTESEVKEPEAENKEELQVEGDTKADDLAEAEPTKEAKFEIEETGIEDSQTKEPEAAEEPKQEPTILEATPRAAESLEDVDISEVQEATDTNGIAEVKTEEEPKVDDKGEAKEAEAAEEEAKETEAVKEEAKEEDGEEEDEETTSSPDTTTTTTDSQPKPSNNNNNKKKNKKNKKKGNKK